MAGEVALNIFGSRTIYPLTPSLSPRVEGVIRIRAKIEGTTKDQRHKEKGPRPRFQQGAGADRE